MDLTAEQRDLRDAVRALLDHSGQDPWPRLCREIGVAGLAIPERYGGAGAGPVEVHLVMEELGRRLTPSPLLGSAVLTAQALLGSGDNDACRRLLPALAEGSVAALAWTTRDGHWRADETAFRATCQSGHWVLTGEAHHVLDGDRAETLLAAARTPDGVALFEVDPHGPGVARAAVTTMDPARALAVVCLTGAPGRLIGRCPDDRSLTRARDLACIALGAEQAGAAQRALELTVAHTQHRVQFGRPLAGFQALQHRMADLYVLVESARSLSYATASAAADASATTEGWEDLGLRAAAVKVYCSQALTAVAGR